MVHPELLGLPTGMIFIGYYKKYLAEHFMDFRTKVIGKIVIDEKGRTPAEDEDGNIYRQGEDFPVFVALKELVDDGMDILWFFEFNPMIATLNGR